jgi:hypothetical protein
VKFPTAIQEYGIDPVVEGNLEMLLMVALSYLRSLLRI